MQSKLEKVVAGLKTGPRFLKELREFDNLVKAIGECKSKAEEDRIIVQELELLKQRLSDPKLDKSRGKEYLIRLIYCEMLGHDASFAYVKALQFASDPNIHTKKAAYLALAQFLDYNNQLVLLLVNTLLLDLKSDNYLIVCTALVAATKLIGPDLVNAVYPVVVERLRHPKEHVRKKAVLALHWFGQLDPRRDGPLAGVELDKHFRTMLCDKDPSVMSAALCALHDSIKANPRQYKNLIPSFTSILKQVSEHRLPKSYDYHRFPAPFIQIKLLKILAVLGAGDRSASENMAAVLLQTLRRANTSHTIGSAIIYECVRTITTIYPNPQLLAAAADSIGTFLRSPSHNLRYVGIDALAGISVLNPAAAAEHQVAVLDCLEDPDDTLKLKTLELLYKMTKANNIQVIVDKMMGYLSSCTDDHIRRDIVRKVSDLAERYAPSPSWFVTTISEVFRLGGEHVGEAEAHRLTRLIAEQDASLHTSAVEAYLGLLDGEAAAAAAAAGGSAPAVPRKKLPETILLVICWVLGEYGHLARRPPLAVLARLVGILTTHKAATERVRCTLLTALIKLAAHTGGPGGPVGTALRQPHSAAAAASAAGAGAGQEAVEFVHKCLSSQSLELQQRAHELQALLSCPATVLSAALPADASCEDFSESDLEQMAALPFLEPLAARARAAGAAPYLPPESRANKAGEGHPKGLRFEAYEPAPYAIPLAAASTSFSAGAVSSDARAAAAAAAAGSSAGPSSHAAGAAAAAATPLEPQLVVKGGASRKWGPAQYEADPGPGPSGQSVTASGPSSSAPAAAAAVAGGGRGGSHHSRTGSGAAAAPAPSERERLAASLFGGGGGGGGGGLGALAPAAAGSTATRPASGSAAGAAAAYKQTNGTSAAAALGRPPPQQQLPSAMDLLLDLDVLAPGAAATSAGPSVSGRGPVPPPAGDWMDSLISGAQTGHGAPPGPMGVPGVPGRGMGTQGMGGGPSASGQPPLMSVAPHGGGGAGGGMPAGMGPYGMASPRAPYPTVPAAGVGIGMAGGVMPPPSQQQQQQPLHAGQQLPVGGVYGAPQHAQQQAWQQQPMRTGPGMAQGGMAGAVWPQAAAPPPAAKQLPPASDPFRDLLG